MSLISLNMAKPFKPNVYVLPDPYMQEEIKHQQLKNRKYILIKCVQLVLSIVCIILFQVGASASESTVLDMMICVSFGAIVIYALMFLSLKLNFASNRADLVILNILATVGTMIIGFLIFVEWWDVQNALDEVSEQYSKMIVIEAESAATLKLISSLICFLNSAIYLSESSIIVLEHIGYI